jgi:glyoxylase-like metal-dependent hydrolase (beta-lactamase superfamily II)/rhodanese-related sulfurtransferase
VDVSGPDASAVTTADELLAVIDSGTPMFLLDVREPDEFEAWRIPSATLIPLGDLAHRLGDVPTDRPCVVLCASGTRALQAQEILAGAHIPSSVLAGGMGSWGHVYDVVEGTFDDVNVAQVRRRGKGCLSYVVSDDTRAVVIDPSTETGRYREIADAHGVPITHVLDTHLHADHVSGARMLARDTGAELLLNPADGFAYEFTPIEHGLHISLGATHLAVSAVSAPGHTEGSTVYRLANAAVFTGDTLFLESVGRPDLADQAEPFAHALYQSLHHHVLSLPDDVLVFPAHFSQTVNVRGGEFLTARLGDLRTSLPALALSEDDFVAWAVDRATDRPDNYREIVQFNAGRTNRPLSELLVLESGPNRCAIAS